MALRRRARFRFEFDPDDPDSVLAAFRQWVAGQESGEQWIRRWLEGDRPQHTVIMPYTVWGDYVGSTVERSNYDVLADEWREQPWVILATGDYDYYGHAIIIDVAAAERDVDGMISILEAASSLSQYPLYNEDHHSHLESELQNAYIEESVDTIIQRHLNLGVYIIGEEDLANDIDDLIAKSISYPVTLDTRAQPVRDLVADIFVNAWRLNDYQPNFSTETAVSSYIDFDEIHPLMWLAGLLATYTREDNRHRLIYLLRNFVRSMGEFAPVMHMLEAYDDDSARIDNTRSQRLAAIFDAFLFTGQPDIIEALAAERRELPLTAAQQVRLDQALDQV